MTSAELRECRPCNLCGCERFDPFYDWPANYYPHGTYETASWDGRESLDLSIVRCSDCGFAYTRPSFKVEHLDRVYPADIIPEELPNSELMASQKWDDIITLLREHLPPKASVCDIGARYGVLVKKLADAGFDSFGVEFNLEAISRGRCLGVDDLYQGMISDVPDVVAKRSIDQVNAFILDDVLEHLVDPMADIRSLASVQKPGDLVLARQMDLQSLGHRAFRKNWYYLQPGAHMSFFDEPAARRLFEAAGYRVVRVIRTPLPKQCYLLLRRWLKPVKALVRGPQKRWEVNGKTMYLHERQKLSDMFLVVAERTSGTA